jgi:CheY-like chemotaxis protein
LILPYYETPDMVRFALSGTSIDYAINDRYSGIDVSKYEREGSLIIIDSLRGYFSSDDHPLLALEHFRINQKDYSLIISDIRMPIMNGFEFVREARKINPKVKIVLMTAFEINDKEFARVLPKPKIDGLLRKPVSTKQILSTVSNIIKA